jgi:hypothetical protein
MAASTSAVDRDGSDWSLSSPAISATIWTATRRGPHKSHADHGPQSLQVLGIGHCCSLPDRTGRIMAQSPPVLAPGQ